MEIRLSSTVSCIYPFLASGIREITRLSQALDENIIVQNLLIEVRAHWKPSTFCGRAYPDYASWKHGQRRTHSDGRILLTIGAGVGEEDLIRLLSHELRHIGQFHRGIERCGYMTADYLDDDVCENDAYDFEDYVLEAHTGALIINRFSPRVIPAPV